MGIHKEAKIFDKLGQAWRFHLNFVKHHRKPRKLTEVDLAKLVKTYQAKIQGSTPDPSVASNGSVATPKTAS